jgi:predicted RNase H-like HicB family nuclease
MKKYKLIIEKGEDGFWGRLEKPDGIYSFGETLKLLKANMNDAIKLYFEENEFNIHAYEFDIVMDIQNFFIINDYINISNLAKRVGMNSSLLRQYAKGIKHPNIKQVNKIELAIKEIGQELIKTELQFN